MSNTDLNLNDTIAEQEADAEIRRKENELFHDSINVKHEDLEKRKEEQRQQGTFDLTTRNTKYIKKKQKENREYLEGAKTAQTFLDNDVFRGCVPFFRKNIVLIGALSGDGKSTTCANIAYNTMIKGGKVLVISNEEDAADVYNRITCILKGWSYHNHADFSSEQIDIFEEYVDKISHRVTVIDDSWNGGVGMTTTIEGVGQILSHIRKNNIHYDVIIWDYYQNISRSTKSPNKNPYECQHDFAGLLDNFKNTYSGVNVVLAQLKPSDEPFQYKIQGRKSIYEKCTCAIEAVAERDKFATSWVIHKSRWSQSLGKTLWTGFDKGKYVEFTDEFQIKSSDRALYVKSKIDNARKTKERLEKAKKVSDDKND